MQLYLKENKSFIHDRLVRFEFDICFIINDSKEQKIKKEEGILSLKVILMESIVY